MKLKINEPCHEDWNKMNSNDYKIGINTRHCDSCVKSVVDFTESSRAEIITYMLSNRDNSVCGRLRADQFDFRHEDIPVLLETLDRQKTSNPFLVLALVCMSLSAYGQQEVQTTIKTPPPVENTVRMGKVAPIVKGGMIAVEVEFPEPDTTKINCEIVEQGEVRLGDIAIQTPDPTQENKVYKYTSNMPEYPGGIGKMTMYLQDNTNYHTANATPGTVYVRFVVEADGKITRLEIARGINSVLDKEAIRLISTMPKWKPGEKDGKKVAVYMTVPVRFEN